MRHTEDSMAPAIADLGTDFAEIAVDSFLEEGIVQEIPILKTIFVAYKTGTRIKDSFTLQKILSFLKECKNISQEEVQNFIQNIGDEKKISEFGMRLFLVIDKVDEIPKAELIGRLFVLLLKREIDVQFYLRLCHMINSCLYDDILGLKHFVADDTILTSENEIVDTVVLESLFSSGLISDYGFDGGNAWGKNSGTRFGINKYGTIVKRVLQ